MMRRTPFASKATPRREATQYEGSSPSAPRAPAPSVTSVDMLRPLPPAHVPPRDMMVARGSRIRASANGEECQVRYAGVCTRDTAHTIWSHARWGAQLGDAGRGMATKAEDLAGAYACTACDSVYDGQRQAPGLSRSEVDLDWCMGHFRSLGILARKGLL